MGDLNAVGRAWLLVILVGAVLVGLPWAYSRMQRFRLGRRYVNFDLALEASSLSRERFWTLARQAGLRPRLKTNSDITLIRHGDLWAVERFYRAHYSAAPGKLSYDLGLVYASAVAGAALTHAGSSQGVSSDNLMPREGAGWRLVVSPERYKDALDKAHYRLFITPRQYNSLPALWAEITSIWDYVRDGNGILDVAVSDFLPWLLTIDRSELSIREELDLLQQRRLDPDGFIHALLRRFAVPPTSPVWRVQILRALMSGRPVFPSLLQVIFGEMSLNKTEEEFPG